MSGHSRLRGLQCGRTNISRPGFDEDARQDSYGEPYSPEPYQHTALPPQSSEHQYYPNTNYFPPPPGSAPRPAGSTAPYNPADYPPPPVAVPPSQQYGYPPPGPESFVSRPRRADENVSAAWNSSPPISQAHMDDGGFRDNCQCTRGNSNSKTLGLNIQSPTRTPRAKKRRPCAASQSPQSKSVAFDLSSEDGQQMDPGYETDDSDSTIGSSSGVRRHGHRRHHSSSESYSSRTESETQRMASEKKARSNTSGKEIESDSDSTIDLPDRFDSQGRLLPQHEDNMFAGGLDSLLRGINRVFV